MCRPASMIVLKGFIPKWSLKTDSHSEIIREFGLNDSSAVNMVRGEAPFVGIEITPPSGRFDAPLDQWEFSVDPDYASILPEWWDADLAEKAVRSELLNWFSKRVVLTHIYEEVRDRYVYVCGSATVKACDSATVEAYGSATVEAYGSATTIVARRWSGGVKVKNRSADAVLVDRRTIPPTCVVGN